MFKRQLSQQLRGFKSFAPLNVKIGDKIPSVKLFENSPSDSFDISQQVANGTNLIVTVPGAFSPGCTARHVPGYQNDYSKFANKGVNEIFIVSVNDSFVMKAWSDSFGDHKGIRFIADPEGEFAKSLDLSFDATPFFGNERLKRSAILVKDGLVEKTFVEPDNTSVNVSEADKVLKGI